MGNRRFGEGQNLTPNQASILLPTPILWVLLGLAVPIFVDTDRSNPSSLVRIQATENHIDYVGLSGIPMLTSIQVINAKQWETGVLPVLIDPLVSPDTTINQNLIKYNIEEYLRLLGIIIGQKFSIAGYGPYSVL